MKTTLIPSIIRIHNILPYLSSVFILISLTYNMNNVSCVLIVSQLYIAISAKCELFNIIFNLNNFTFLFLNSNIQYPIVISVSKYST